MTACTGLTAIELFMFTQDYLLHACIVWKECLRRIRCLQPVIWIYFVYFKGVSIGIY